MRSISLQVAQQKIAAHFGTNTSQRKAAMHNALVERFGEDFDETHSAQAEVIISEVLEPDEFGNLSQSTMEDLEQWLACNYLA